MYLYIYICLYTIYVYILYMSIYYMLSWPWFFTHIHVEKMIDTYFHQWDVFHQDAATRTKPPLEISPSFREKTMEVESLQWGKKPTEIGDLVCKMGESTSSWYAIVDINYCYFPTQHHHRWSFQICVGNIDGRQRSKGCVPGWQSWQCAWYDNVPAAISR